MPLQCEDRYVNPACAPGYLRSISRRPRRRTTCCEVAPLWEAQYAIEASAADGAGGAAARHRARRPLPGRRAAHREPRRADHAGAPGASRARATSSRAVSGHDARRLVALADVAAAALAQRRRRHARAAGLAGGRRLARARQRRRDRGATARSPRFPACERWFAVLEGDGVRADDRRRRRTLHAQATRRSRSPAAAAPTADCSTGPTRDFNLMLRGADAAMCRRVAGEAWRRSRRRCGLYTLVAGTAAASTRPRRCPAASAALVRPGARHAALRAPGSIDRTGATACVARAAEALGWTRSERRDRARCGATAAPRRRWPTRNGWGLIERGALLVDGDTHRLGRLRAPNCPRLARSRVDAEHDLGGALVTPGPGRLPHAPGLRRRSRARIRAAPARARATRRSRAPAAASARPCAPRARPSDDELFAPAAAARRAR